MEWIKLLEKFEDENKIMQISYNEVRENFESKFYNSIFFGLFY